MRKPTMRNAVINKTTIIKYANRTGEMTDLGFGEKQYAYGDIKEMDICLLNFTDVFSAKAYGVDVMGGLRATLTYEQAQEFNKFTNIWINTTPPADRQFPEYYVVKVPSSINQGLLVINKVDGN